MKATNEIKIYFAMNLRDHVIGFAIVVLAYCGVLFSGRANDIGFNVNYAVTWGNDHVSFFNQETDVQLSLDSQSGAGFGSKLSYGSGFFHMRIKLPNRNSAGVVTAFYLSSNPNSNKHDELDFEFLGNKEGKPITLQTNVYVNGQGGREQRFNLWFDPTADFHTYKVLWNEYQVVFYVDNTPIRIFKNNTNIGVAYITHPMQIAGSLWNATWATDGGKTPIDWSYAPFIASFQDFNVAGCQTYNPDTIPAHCYSSSEFWWNESKYWKLSHEQKKSFESARQNNMNYDYCTDSNYYPVPPPECSVNT